MGKFEQVGGLEYLAELPEKVPTTANAMKYIKIVEEKSTLRRLIKTANEIIELGYSPTEDVEDIMEGAEKKIFNIMQEKNQKAPYRTVFPFCRVPIHMAYFARTSSQEVSYPAPRRAT